MSSPARPTAPVLFSNPGVLDPRAFTTFGLGAKPGSDRPIGQFGTGLKYAIAAIARLGGAVRIAAQSPEGHRQSYNFFTQTEEFRGKEFETVWVEDSSGASRALGFTTELGKHWAPWMAYRELQSNMLDEGGINGEPLTQWASWTKISVECREIEEAYLQSENWFLSGEPLWSGPGLEIFPGREQPGIFYRGIRVASLAEQSLYTYNILSPQSLTEDRTLDLWRTGLAIVWGLELLDNQSIAERVLLSPDSLYESKLDWSYAKGFSPTMREAMKLHQHNKDLNRSAAKHWRRTYAEDFVPKALPMTEEEHQRAELAKDLFSALGLEWPWEALRVGEAPPDGLETQTIGGTLWISRETLSGPDWLLEVLKYRRDGRDWEPYAEEKDILRIAEHLGLSPVTEPLATSLSTDLNGDDIPF